MDDRPNLAYTEAVLHESMRLASVAPSGLTHATSCDTEICEWSFFSLLKKYRDSGFKDNNYKALIKMFFYSYQF